MLVQDRSGSQLILKFRQLGLLRQVGTMTDLTFAEPTPVPGKQLVTFQQEMFQCLRFRCTQYLLHLVAVA